MPPPSLPDTARLRETQWLYKQGELILGPVDGDQLIAKLYTGEVTGQTDISPLGENQFRKVANLEAFSLHLAKAEAKLRVEAAARAAEGAANRKRNIILASVGAVALIAVILAITGARYLAVHTPWSHGKDLDLSDIVVEPPTIAVAHAKRSAEDLVDYPGVPSLSHHRERSAAPEHAGSEHAAPSRPEHSGHAVASRSAPSGQTTDPDGMQVAQVDQDAIRTVVAEHERSLYPCFMEQGRRSPGMSAKIPLEFAIGNDGKVSQLWIDNPQFKTGPLADCLLRELKKWPFPSSSSAGATVNLAFTIGHHS